MFVIRSNLNREQVKYELSKQLQKMITKEKENNKLLRILGSVFNFNKEV